jgi:hypothetical protein
MWQTMIGVGILTVMVAGMCWWVYTSMRAEDRRELDKLNTEYKQLLEQHGRDWWSDV